MLVGLLHEFGLSLKDAQDSVLAVREVDPDATIIEQIVMLGDYFCAREVPLRINIAWQQLQLDAKLCLEFVDKIKDWSVSCFYVRQISDRDWRLFWRGEDEVWVHEQVNETWIGAENLRRMDRLDSFHAAVHKDWVRYNG